MEVSILLMQQIVQLFIVLLMGYVVVKAGLLKASDSKVLSVVFVYLVMPCVVLNAFQIDDTPQIRTELLYSMGIAVGMHVVFLVLNAIFKRLLKLDVVEQVNIIYSNAAALVIPLVQALLGEEYVVYSCAFVIVQLILLWTHASACLQEGTKLEWKKILTNVNLIAIVAGALLYILHTAQLSSHCAPSAGRTDGGTAPPQCHPRIHFDCGWQGDSHDGVPVRYHAGLCDCHLDGAAVQQGCGAFECPVCTQHVALYNYNAHHDRSV